MVRIRKNLKVSPLQFFPNVAPEDLQPHICKLNQSPWDSNPCPFDLFLDSSPLLQFRAGEGFIGNGSLGDSIAAVESVASPMDIDKAEVAGDDVVDNVDKVFIRCVKNDGRSWQCKKEAKEGFLLCDHHLMKKYGNNNIPSKGNILPSKFVFAKKDTAASAKTLAGNRRPRLKAVKNGASSADPYEFYYYSGFGPKWGRKRNKKAKQEEEKEEANNNEVVAGKVATSSGTSSANIDPQPSSPRNVGNGHQMDYMEDDFDDEDGSDEEGGGPRRIRRPVKARSLMSIINSCVRASAAFSELCTSYLDRHEQQHESQRSSRRAIALLFCWVSVPLNRARPRCTFSRSSSCCCSSEPSPKLSPRRWSGSSCSDSTADALRELC